MTGAVAGVSVDEEIAQVEGAGGGCDAGGGGVVRDCEGEEIR